jgi:hypothetical protein
MKTIRFFMHQIVEMKVVWSRADGEGAPMSCTARRAK